MKRTTVHHRQTRHICLLFLLLLTTVTKSLAANQSIAELFGQNYWGNLRNINLGSHAFLVSHILEDKTGMIWVTADNGLFSYDGYHVQSYPTTQKLGFLFTSCLEGDNLVLGNDEGISVFDIKKEKLIDNLTNLKVGETRYLASYQGKVWFCTNKLGLANWTPSTQKVHVELPSLKETVYNILGVGDNLYISTSTGVAVWNISNRKLSNLKMPVLDKKLFINILYYDAKLNCIWIGLEGSLCCYHLTSGVVERISGVPETTYKTIVKDKDDLLLGTDNGLIIYNPEQRTHSLILHDSRNSNSLASNIVWGLFKDSKDNIWMGTDRGVTYKPHNSVSTDIRISSFTKQNDGNLFTFIYKDRKDRFWLGGVNGLILLKNKGNEFYGDIWFQSSKKDKWISHNRVRYIYEDRDGAIWVATDGSILRYNEQQERLEHYTITDMTGKYNANWAYGVDEDRFGNLWIPTYSGGLFIVNKKDLLANGPSKTYKAKKHLSPNSSRNPNGGDNVYFALEDNEGYIWASANNGRGMCRINTRTFAITYIDIFAQMRDNPTRMEHMLFDAKGDVWFSAGQKIGRVDRRSLKVMILKDSQISNESVDAFGYENGHLWFSTSNSIYSMDCQSLHFNSISNSNIQYQSLLCVTDKNTVILGGNDVLTFINPQLFYQNSTRQNRIYITAIYNDNKRLQPEEDFKGCSSRFMKHIVLGPDKQNVIIELSDLTYSPDINRYSYRILELNDRKWTKLNAGENRIDLHQLGYGSYTLQLRNGDNKDASITEYIIEMESPWYLTGWAYALYMLLFLGCVFYIFYYIHKKNERKLEKLKQKQSLELSQMKMDFFTNIAHELKTPLTLIIAPLSRLLPDCKDEKIKAQLSLINENAMNLNILIHKILDFKRMEYNENDVLIRSHIELVSFIRKIVLSYSESMQYDKIQFMFLSKEDTLWANLDYLKIHSIVTNLISNAARFVNKANGKIEVTLKKEADNVVITVQDNGCGIQNHEKNFVFLRFYQAADNKKKREGSGIGLYLVKKYADLHQGSINMESEINKGTTFTVSIPLTGENAIEKKDSAEQQEKARTKSVTYPKLLIVDDNEEILSFLAQTFSKDFICLKASNGKEGYDMATREIPDLAIIDEMMPVMSGLELCRLIKEDSKLNLMSLIMLTAKDERETELQSIEIGVDAFVAKPFDVDKLIIKVKQLINAHEKVNKMIRLEQTTAPITQKKSEELSYDEKFLAKLSKIVEDQITDPDFNVTQLSSAMAIDQKQLYRKLKALMGVTPVNFIRQIRLRKAASLLEQNKFTVSEIMYMVGFNNQAYFSKCFLSEFGTTPTEYAQKNKNSESS